MYERHPAITIACILVVAYIGLDVVASLVFGPLDAKGEGSWRIKDDVYHHTLAPNVDTIDSFGGSRYEFRTNSLGFKDGEVREIPKAGQRLLFIGDSFTEGVGFPYRETFAGLVGEQVPVLNAAVVSYSPSIYRRKVERLIDQGYEFDRLYVFLDISDINDEGVQYALVRGNVVSGVRLSGLTRSVKEFLSRWLDFSYTGARYLWHAIKSARDDRTDEQIRFGLGTAPAQWDVDETAFEDHGRRGLAKSDRELSALSVRLGDIPMTLAVHPWPDQIFAGKKSKQQIYWRKWAEAKGIEFIDFFPLFDGEPKEVVARYYIPGDVHWNAAGHKLVADALLERIRRTTGNKPRGSSR